MSPKRPEEVHKTLCDKCNSLDISANEFVARDSLGPAMGAVDLGVLPEVRSRPECVLCSFVASKLTTSLPAEDRQDLVTRCMMSWQDYSDTGEIAFGNGYHVLRLLVATPEEYISLGLLAEDAPERHLQGRRIQWEQAPFETIKSWLAQCLKGHGAKCEKTVLQTWSPPWDIPDIRLIDVQEACLIKMRKDCEYISLSYVWGTIPGFMTTRGNIEELERPGILRTLAHQLPRTIRDAIDLVGTIGYRFLWVDRLCIVQDDGASVQANIWNMDRIYGQSMLLIIAADGDHADAGLSRTGALTGNHQQTILPIEPTLRLVTIDDSRALRDKSTYQRRGWTYQEEFFARRKLVFVGSRVFFECRGACWQEDIALEDGMIQSKAIQRSITWHRDSIYKSYGDSVHDFTSRQLTFPTDVMNAFAGVSNYWAESLRATMKYGLPNSVFDWAILWIPRYPLRQRQGGGCTFPTWSWAGWVGPVVLNTPFQEMQFWLTYHTWIVWYQWSPSLTALLWDVNHERNGKTRRGDEFVGYRVSNTIDPFGRNKNRFLIGGKSQEEMSAPFAEVQGLDDSRLRSSLHSKSGQILLFWTMSAKFDLEYDEDSDGRPWVILDRRGVAAGRILSDQGPEAMQADLLNDQSAFELIALSDAPNTNIWAPDTYQDADLTEAVLKKAATQDDRQTELERLTVIDLGPSIEDPGSWGRYNVMVINWQGPIAVRRGIGTISKRAMKHALDPGWTEMLKRRNRHFQLSNCTSPTVHLIECIIATKP